MKSMGRTTAGFTVTELLIASLILVIVLAALGRYIASSTRAQQASSDATVRIQDAEALQQILQYELQRAGYRGVDELYASRDLDASVGTSDTTVIIDVSGPSHVLEARYYETDERFLAAGDTGLRNVRFFVSDGLMFRDDGTTTDPLAVAGTIASMRATTLIARNGLPTIIDGPATEIPDRLAAIGIRLDFTDGSSWEFPVGFVAAQSLEIVGGV